MIKPSDVSGVVLAGGRAERMQSLQDPGSRSTRVDKGLLVLGGLPLVAHATRRLSPYVAQVFISANQNVDRYGEHGSVVSDAAWSLGMGPLAGVASVLAQVDTPWLMTLPVDMVGLPPDCFDKLLHAAVETDASIVYASTLAGTEDPGPREAAASRRDQPLCMLMRTKLAADLRRYLETGGRQVWRWQALHHARRVFFPPLGDAFFNVNTPDDWAQANQWAKS